MLAVTNALEQKLAELRPSLPAGRRDRHHLRPLVAHLGDADQLLPGDRLRADRRHPRDRAVALQNVRARSWRRCASCCSARCSPRSRSSAFDQTINLFALAGLAIAIGEMADATIVIVENCTAELARRGRVHAPPSGMETIIRATANVTRPLLFSMLIIVTSFLPIFFLGAREGRLFNPLAFSKTFAMAFSTLLTLFLLPVDHRLGVQARTSRLPTVRPRAASSAPIAAALVGAIRYRYAFVGVSAALFVGAAVVLAGFQKDYMPEMEEGSILYMPTTLPGLPSKRGRLDPSADGQEAEGVSGGRARLRQARARRHRDGSGAGRDDRDHGHSQAAVRVARGHDEGQAHRRDEPGDADRRLRQQLDAADQHARDDAGHRHPDAGRHQGQGHRPGASVEEIAQQVEALLQGLSRHAGRHRRTHLAGYFVDAQLDLERMAAHGVTVDEAMPTVQFAIGGDNVVGIRQADKTIVPLAIQYSPEYVDTLAKVRNTPVVTADGRSVPLGEIADVAVREAPEMIRNDNGDAGRLRLRLPRRTA